MRGEDTHRHGLGDHLAPVGIGRRQAQAEKAQGGDGDRRVAEAEASVDDERPPRVGQKLDQHDAPGWLPAGLGGEDVVPGLEVEHEPTHDPHDARSRGEGHREHDVGA